VTDGPGLSLQDTAEQQTTLTVATQRHVDTGFSTAEMALSLDDYAERITAPKMNNLGGNVAKTIMLGIGERLPTATPTSTAPAIFCRPPPTRSLRPALSLTTTRPR
jgi:hypothetical protein